ncbi:protein phosphatase methylesterase 1-like [Octopus vulgaris]|uniref:Protein phosphatase methylesterase 1 n=1 Tax=Octopus vulgaris TaxID=6645 RepID=A0AA36BA32_OCTVU|nr:protein phosphatase methylesterase 1-like [Octopus vulgaris]
MRKQVLSNQLPSMPPSTSYGSNNRRGNLSRQRDYTPSTWDKYYHKKHDIEVGKNTFRVYECGKEGPVLFLLHGGGYSGLSWALLSATLCELVSCRCVALDLRGHGDSVTEDDTDLSSETLSSDVGAVINEMYGTDNPPPIILIGHSMGAAIAVHTAVRSLVPSLAGLVVIDVVEGTAMEALSSMQSFLRGRPSFFRSIEEAIEWSLRSGQLRNVESAKISLVGQVKRVDTGETATFEQEHPSQEARSTSKRSSDTIAEEDEESGDTSLEEVKSESSSMASATTPPPPTPPPPNMAHSLPEVSSTTNKKNVSYQYTWRIDLSKTDKYWSGWFRGLSEKFLSCNVPKLLLLAGVDRLDKDLTIGQMQGKFQMQVLPQCGHAVHEDVPDKVADVLATFLVRHKMAIPIGDFERTFPAC